MNATEAQNNFGRVLSRAAREGAVFIRRYNQTEAVILSVERYRQLTGEDTELEQLARTFDAALEEMQTEKAAAAGDELFEMESDELGEAAVRGTQHRNG